MPRLISALLVRNEAGSDRYLARVLGRCREFSDAIVVLDDRSTDTTVKLCRSFGAHVQKRSIVSGPAWGREAPARQELWDLAVQHCADEGDWVLFVDADMALHGDPRPLLETHDLNAWAFPLYDLWDSEETYRADQFWQGHQFPRVWLVAPKRVPLGWFPQWLDRGIHCGHLPENLPLVVGVAPPDIYWLHLGWVKESHRQAKHAQYLQTADQLTPFERAHADSIITPP